MNPNNDSELNLTAQNLGLDPDLVASALDIAAAAILQFAQDSAELLAGENP